MSTKHVRTAADLVRFRCGLKVECLKCGHILTLEGYEGSPRGWHDAAEGHRASAEEFALLVKGSQDGDAYAPSAPKLIL